MIHISKKEKKRDDVVRIVLNATRRLGVRGSFHSFSSSPRRRRLILASSCLFSRPRGLNLATALYPCPCFSFVYVPTAFPLFLSSFGFSPMREYVLGLTLDAGLIPHFPFLPLFLSLSLSNPRHSSRRVSSLLQSAFLACNTRAR